MSRKSIFTLTIVSVLVFIAVIVSVFVLNGYNPMQQPQLKFMVDDEIYYSLETTGNTEITMPEDPTKEGFIFDGWWYKNEDAVETEFKSESLLEVTLSSDMIVYSKWIEITYSLNFVVDNEIYDTLVTAGKKEIEMPENPTKNGYVFIGWYQDQETLEVPFTSLTLVNTRLTSDMTVYAKWNAVYTINGSVITGLTEYAEENLTEIVVPSTIDNVEILTIKNKAFYGNTNLVNVTISDGVKTIGNNVFYNCTNLETIKIGKDVTSIGTSAFYNCNNLTSIIIDAENENYTSRDTSGNECNAIINVNTKALVKGCNLTTIPADESVISIEDNAFVNCTGIT